MREDGGGADEREAEEEVDAVLRRRGLDVRVREVQVVVKARHHRKEAHEVRDGDELHIRYRRGAVRIERDEDCKVADHRDLRAPCRGGLGAAEVDDEEGGGEHVEAEAEAKAHEVAFGVSARRKAIGGGRGGVEEAELLSRRGLWRVRERHEERRHGCLAGGGGCCAGRPRWRWLPAARGAPLCLRA